MTNEVASFFDDFDHYASEVSLARHQDHARMLRQWFRTLEDAPEPLRSRIAWLRSKFSAERLSTEVIVQGRGMVGSGRLNWPDDLQGRLSSQLALLEALTEKEDSAWRFAMNFFPARSNNLNDIVSELNTHLIEPHVRELRRYLEKNADTPIRGSGQDEIPASDRVVSLHHNTAAHNATDAALEDVERSLLQSNDGDPEDKERVVAEVSAARKLLSASKVRVVALATLLGSALSWIASQFAETAVGKAAEWAIQKLTEYLPMLSDFF
jgi:hypothetical protein